MNLIHRSGNMRRACRSSSNNYCSSIVRGVRGRSIVTAVDTSGGRAEIIVLVVIDCRI